MTVTVGYTQADVDTLRAACASGILTVNYSGPPARSITYQSTEAMLIVLGRAVAELANAAGTRAPFKLINSRKGA